MELVNPEIPTYASGSALDKVLFAQGKNIPSTLLPPQGAEGNIENCEMEYSFFPATVLNYTRLSDHLPIILPIPCMEENGSKDTISKIKVNNLTEEEWQTRDEDLGEHLAQACPLDKLREHKFTTDHLLRTITAAINRVFHKERRTKECARKLNAKEPIERFLYANLWHPEMPELLTALEN